MRRHLDRAASISLRGESASYALTVAFCLRARLPNCSLTWQTCLHKSPQSSDFLGPRPFRLDFLERKAGAHGCRVTDTVVDNNGATGPCEASAATAWTVIAAFRVA